MCCYSSMLRVVFLHFVIANAQWATADEDCKTPKGEVGNCVVIHFCKPIVNILDAVNSQNKPIPREVTDLLKSYHCGFSGRNPKVCCPSKPIYVEGITNPTPTPPDVSNHRNIGLLPKDCGRLDTGDKIVNGNRTGVLEFPWMALLSYRTSYGPDFQCGGSIINNRYILTAAHCITNLKNPLIGVRIGEHNTKTQIDCELTREGDETCSPPHRDLPIEQLIPHPDFTIKPVTNDIGLIRVASPIDLSQVNTRPVCLPLDKTRIYDFANKNGVVTGWGATEKSRNSDELLKVQLPIVPQEECVRTYINLTTIDYKQMCAGGRTGSDSCGGDSGGPLKVVGFLHGDTRLIQQGIVSFGPRDCGLLKLGLPGVYTRVAYYMDWILDNIRR